ncbi:MAG: class B sortase [Lachnospiraceae bacterium]
MKKNHKSYHRGRRKVREKKEIWRTIILVVAICVFLVSAYQLCKIGIDYYKGYKEYDNINDMVITTDKKDEFKVDWKKLKSINEDVVAWIRFDEPSIISYPVAHGKDNQQYLRHTLEGEYNIGGTLFIDAGNSGDMTDKNTIIYGHRIKTGIMFGKLESYADKEFYKKYPYFYIYTPNGKKATYQIFSVTVVKDVSDAYNYRYQTPEEFQTYLDAAKSISDYDTGVKVTAKDQIVSLSTCTKASNEDRFLVRGVKIKEE